MSHFSPSALDIRRPVWKTLSNLFLDTEVRHEIPYAAQVCLVSNLDKQTLNDIWYNELHPILGKNVLSLAGEWGVFPLEWLETQISRHKQSRFRIFLYRSSPIALMSRYMLRDTWSEVLRIQDWLQLWEANKHPAIIQFSSDLISMMLGMNIQSRTYPLSSAERKRIWAEAIKPMHNRLHIEPIAPTNLAHMCDPYRIQQNREHSTSSVHTKQNME